MSKVNENDVYLAGVTSAACNNGTSTEKRFGKLDISDTYTGSSWFIRWMDGVQKNETIGIPYLKTCPGVICNHCVLKKGFKDCFYDRKDFY